MRTARQNDDALWKAIIEIQRRLGITDNARVRRGTDPLTAAAQLQTVVTVASLLTDARTNGRAWQLTIPRKTLIAGGYVKLLLTNPATVGSATPVRVIINSAKIVSLISAVGTVTTFQGTAAAPPTNSPTNALTTATGFITNLNTKFSATVPKLTVKYDSATILGVNGIAGTQIDSDLVTSNPSLITADNAIELAPGTTIAIQFGGGVALDFYYKLTWIEVQS